MVLRAVALACRLVGMPGLVGRGLCGRRDASELRCVPPLSAVCCGLIRVRGGKSSLRIETSVYGSRPVWADVKPMGWPYSAPAMLLVATGPVPAWSWNQPAGFGVVDGVAAGIGCCVPADRQIIGTFVARSGLVGLHAEPSAPALFLGLAQADLDAVAGTGHQVGSPGAAVVRVVACGKDCPPVLAGGFGNQGRSPERSFNP